MKRKRFAILILIPLLASGCGIVHKRPSSVTALAEQNPSDQKTGKLIVTPETALIGKVSAVNANAQFVVLNFPIGRLPAMDQRLSIYRHGLKVGEVKVTGPQRDDNTVADIVSGDAQLHDEVRAD